MRSHMYIYTHIRIYIYFFNHTYTNTYTYSHTTLIGMHVHIIVPIHIHVHVHTCIYIYIHMHMHMYIHKYLHIRIHIHVHLYAPRYRTDHCQSFDSFFPPRFHDGSPAKPYFEPTPIQLILQICACVFSLILHTILFNDALGHTHAGRFTSPCSNKSTAAWWRVLSICALPSESSTAAWWRVLSNVVAEDTSCSVQN